VAQLFSLGILTPHNNLKTKQLANVLIKILGLSVILNDIPSVLASLITFFQVPKGSGGSALLYLMAGMIAIVVGIVLIVTSRSVAEHLFKDDDE
jgi:hypothetical protein